MRTDPKFAVTHLRRCKPPFPEEETWVFRIETKETRETFKHMIVKNESLRNVSSPHRLLEAQPEDKLTPESSKVGRVSVLCAG